MGLSLAKNPFGLKVHYVELEPRIRIERVEYPSHMSEQKVEPFSAVTLKAVERLSMWRDVSSDPAWAYPLMTFNKRVMWLTGIAVTFYTTRPSTSIPQFSMPLALVFKNSSAWWHEVLA